MYPNERGETTYIFTLTTTKNTCTRRKTRTPSNTTINVHLHLIDIMELPNNLNRRDFFPMTCGDIKKLQIREVNNIIAHVFLRRITYHSNETFNSLDRRADKNIFLKPNMISYPPYHPNRRNNSYQPNFIYYFYYYNYYL